MNVGWQQYRGFHGMGNIRLDGNAHIDALRAMRRGRPEFNIGIRGAGVGRNGSITVGTGGVNANWELRTDRLGELFGNAVGLDGPWSKVMGKLFSVGAGTNVWRGGISTRGRPDTREHARIYSASNGRDGFRPSEVARIEEHNGRSELFLRPGEVLGRSMQYDVTRLDPRSGRTIPTQDASKDDANVWRNPDTGFNMTV